MQLLRQVEQGTRPTAPFEALDNAMVNDITLFNMSPSSTVVLDLTQEDQTGELSPRFIFTSIADCGRYSSDRAEKCVIAASEPQSPAGLSEFMDSG